MMAKMANDDGEDDAAMMIEAAHEKRTKTIFDNFLVTVGDDRLNT
jgi:hypothetical protein